MNNSNEANMVKEYCLREVKSEQNTVSILSLRHAIHHDEFSVGYQPGYDTDTGEMNYER